MCFTTTQSKFVSIALDGVLGPLRLARTSNCVPCFSVVAGAMHKASQGTLKGTLSPQESLQGSKTEMRELLGGTEENSVSR